MTGSGFVNADAILCAPMTTKRQPVAPCTVCGKRSVIDLAGHGPMCRRDLQAVQLDTAGVGAVLGIAAASVRRYMVRSVQDERYPFPAPDGRLGPTSWWWASTIVDWMPTRPGHADGRGRARKDATP